MTRIKIILLTLTICFVLAHAANGQDAGGTPTAPVCPAGKVCITVEQARQALVDADTAKAQAVEIKALNDAIDQYKAEIANLRIELAKMTGDKTGAEQMIVRLTAIVDFMLKNGRTKKYGIINF